MKSNFGWGTTNGQWNAQTVMMIQEEIERRAVTQSNLHNGLSTVSFSLSAWLETLFKSGLSTISLPYVNFWEDWKMETLVLTSSISFVGWVFSEIHIFTNILFYYFMSSQYDINGCFTLFDALSTLLWILSSKLNMVFIWRKKWDVYCIVLHEKYDG